MFIGEELAEIHPAPSATASKDEFRTWAKMMRTRIRSTPNVAEAQIAIAQYVAQIEGFKNAENVLTYVAFGSEVRMRSIMDLHPEKHYFSTRIERQEKGEMTIRSLRGAKMIKHPFGPYEPSEDSDIADPQSIDVAIVPGLAFDQEGRRLGYGRGFYDRMIPRMRDDVVLIGVTFNALITSSLPSEEHDERVHYIVSESGIFPTN